MDYGYHITNKSNIGSIVQYGLVPGYWFHSNAIGEDKMFVYFTEKDFVSKWINLLRLGSSLEEIAVLSFPCSHYCYEKRHFNDHEYVTTNRILSNDLSVVLDNQTLSIFDYYNENKKVLYTLEKDEIIFLIQKIKIFCGVIANNKDDRMRVDPNVFEIVYFINKLKDFKDKDLFFDAISTIKDMFFPLLLDGNFGITMDSEIFKVISLLFDGLFTSGFSFDIMTMNYIAILLESNLYYRKLIRYEKTGRPFMWNETWEYGDIDRNIEDIKKSFMNYPILSNLLDEIYQLYTLYYEMIGEKEQKKKTLL